MMFIILIIGALLSVLFYLIGSLFLLHGLKKRIGFIQHVVNFWIGLLISVSLYAIVKANFITILFLIPIIIFAFKKSLVNIVEVKQMSTLMFITALIVIYVFLFFLQIHFTLDALYNPFNYVNFIHPDDGERYVYSSIMSLVHYRGVETISPESVLHNTSGVSLYHFIEFWLGSLFKTIYNAKSDIVLFYFVFPIFKTFIVLSALAIFYDQLKDRNSFIIILIVLFCFVVLGFRYVFLPVYKNDLRNIVMLPMLLMVYKFIYIKRLDTALSLLMIASVENILFMPALFVFVVIFFYKVEKVVIVKFLIFIFMYILFFYFFKEDVQDKYFSFGLNEAISSAISTLKSNFKYVILGFLYFPVRILLSYLLIINYKNIKNKLFEINLSWWILLSFLVYNIIFSLIANLSIDAPQFRVFAFLLAKIALLFIIYEFLKKKRYIICTTIALLMSDDSYLFAKPKFDDKYNLELEKKLEIIGNGRMLKGLFVDEESTLPSQFYIYYYPTRAIEYARSNDYRMHLYNYDITAIRSSISNMDLNTQVILKRHIQPLFLLNDGILENINRNGISIIWISRRSKYLDAFDSLKPLYELEDYLVYDLNPALGNGKPK